MDQLWTCFVPIMLLPAYRGHLVTTEYTYDRHSRFIWIRLFFLWKLCCFLVLRLFNNENGVCCLIVKNVIC